MAVGGVLGAGCHQAVDTYIVGGLLRPVSRFLGFYTKLGELAFLTRTGAISPTNAARLQRRITEEYLLRRSTMRELPPGE
jgi:hypothetical protein